MSRIFCSLDTPHIDKALYLSQMAAEAGCGLKFGLEFFANTGPTGLEKIRSKFPDTPIFLDLKFHDIPNTVAEAVRGVTRLGVQYLNCHASGGFSMMQLAQAAMSEEATRLGIQSPQLLAVTVLTSLDETALTEVGQQGPARDQVLRLATLTQKAGLAGVVCSGHEIETLRHALGPDFVLMVPGIRPKGADVGDQKRIMTPPEALKAGATHLVIGRPITGAADPFAAAKAIFSDIEQAGV